MKKEHNVKLNKQATQTVYQQKHLKILKRLK